jgi:hypothetical protein
MNLMKLAAVAALAIGLSSVAVAQQVEKGQTEVLGYVGGITNNGGAALGGGLQYGFQKHLLASGELGFATGSTGYNLFTFDANAHILLPLKAYPKVTPYGLVGLGFIKATNGGTHDTGLNLGGGARWEVGRDWGVRPEIKVLIADNTSVRFSIGVYKSFGKR